MPAKKKDCRNGPSEVTNKLTQKIIDSQLDTKLGQYIEEELDAVLKKL